MTMQCPQSPDELNVGDRMRDFSTLLDSIESLSQKKKQLWKEIYHNAITDRQNAHATLVQLFQISQGKSTELATHGRTMASMLERMSKSNDQLIRLAELIAKAEQPEGGNDIDDVFKRIREDA